MKPSAARARARSRGRDAAAWLGAIALAACGAHAEPKDAGLRCDADGCVPRAAAPFACNGERCVQLHPRRPDDGEWECVDLEGVVMCRGGEPAAGVVEGPPDRGWACGPRSGHPERVCVDLAPDLPPGPAAAWTCTFARERGGARICEARREPLRPCVGPRCPRAHLTPTCWVDPDCGPLRICAIGNCVDG